MHIQCIFRRSKFTSSLFSCEYYFPLIEWPRWKPMDLAKFLMHSCSLSYHFNPHLWQSRIIIIIRSQTHVTHWGLTRECIWRKICGVNERIRGGKTEELKCGNGISKGTLGNFHNGLGEWISGWSREYACRFGTREMVHNFEILRQGRSYRDVTIGEVDHVTLSSRENAVNCKKLIFH